MTNPNEIETKPTSLICKKVGSLIFLSVIQVIAFAQLYRESNSFGLRSSININGGDTIQKKCESVLNRFDWIYDEKRKVRQEKVNDTNLQLQESGKPLEQSKLFWDLYEPEANCFTEERFGYGTLRRNLLDSYKDLEAREAKVKRYDSFGDGPKFVCGVDVMSSLPSSLSPTNRDDQCLVYSVGSNNNVAFEMSVHKFMGCETHTFDPTVAKKNFVGGKYAIFHQWGLGEDGIKEKWDGFKWMGKSFQTIINKLGHLNRTIDILKIDCEGCEWKAMPPLLDLIAAGTVKVNQIQIEMHTWVSEHERSNELNLNSYFEKLDNAKMRIVHKERNHWGCDGFKCVEYVFVSEEFLRKANQAAVC